MLQCALAAETPFHCRRPLGSSFEPAWRPDGAKRRLRTRSVERRQPLKDKTFLLLRPTLSALQLAPAPAPFQLIAR